MAMLFPTATNSLTAADHPYPTDGVSLINGWHSVGPSLSSSTFPEEKYQSFIEEDASALNEDAVKNTVLPAMLRAMSAADSAQKNVWFNNMDPLVPGISQAKPDYYHGAQPETIHQQVREDLSEYIVPSTATHFPAVPNFFMEVKGPLGTNCELLLQACNSGSIGARAMHMLEKLSARRARISRQSVVHLVYL